MATQAQQHTQVISLEGETVPPGIISSGEQSVTAAQQKIRAKLEERTPNFERPVEQVNHTFGVSADGAEELTGQMSQALEVVTGIGSILTRGYEEVSRTWLQIAEARLQNYADHITALAQCGSLQELIAEQRKIGRDLIQEATENAGRLAELNDRIVKEARQVTLPQREGSGRITSN